MKKTIASLIEPLRQTLGELEAYAQRQLEYGATGVHPILQRQLVGLRRALKQIRALKPDPRLARQQPDDLAAIRALRPRGPRRLCDTIPTRSLLPRLEGAILGRCAGCTLGAAVEGWPIARMRDMAAFNRDPFPPTDYWTVLPEPWALHYNVSPTAHFTRNGMKGVPADDDIGYLLLGLLVLEECGPNFTTADYARVAAARITCAYTAEAVALHNVRTGIPARRAADINNPYTELIGADIRADPWGYVAAGWPEKAAELAYRDAYLSHRRTGIYGSMFFAAAIAAAFTTRHPLDAIAIGLTEIPRQSQLAKEVRWALKTADKITDYLDARERVDRRFPGLHLAHTLNNACLTIFGLAIGGTDFTKVISQTVAMGLDNDCTAATAGSIVGAIVGRDGIPPHWTTPFRNTIHSYLVNAPVFRIRDVARRFAAQAQRLGN